MKKFIFILIVLHCILAFSPMYASGIYKIVDVGILVVLGLLFFKKIKNTYASKITPVFICFFLLITIYVMFGVSSTSFFRACLSLPSFLFSIFITMYCYENMESKELRWLLAIIIFIAFSNILYNSIFCTLNPFAASEARNDFGLREMNIGSTKFSHFALSFFILTLCGFLEYEKKWLRILFIALAILSAYYIIYCGQRMTVVLFLLISTLIFIISKFSKNIRLYIVIVGILAIIVSNNLNSILSGLSANIESERLLYRINSLNETSIYGIDDDSFSGRVYYYKMSLQTFFSGVWNFLFGVGYHEADIFHKSSIGIGGHSQIIDILAMYGVLGAMMIFYILQKTYQYIIHILKDKHHKLLISLSFLIFFTMSLFKYTFDDDNSMLLFFALPLLLRQIENSNIENTNGILNT